MTTKFYALFYIFPINQIKPIHTISHGELLFMDLFNYMYIAVYIAFTLSSVCGCIFK